MSYGTIDIITFMHVKIATVIYEDKKILSIK